MTPTSYRSYVNTVKTAMALRRRFEHYTSLSQVDAQWHMRELEQWERNAERQEQWATRLRFIRP